MQKSILSYLPGWKKAGSVLILLVFSLANMFPALAAGPRIVKASPLPVIQEMVEQVTTAQVSDYDSGLSGEHPVIIQGAPYTITTRSTTSGAPISMATEYVYEHFVSLGFPKVEYFNWSASGYQGRDVIAEQPGSKDPQRIYLITAHLDDTSGSPLTLAPGADDNASGASGVLVAADILSRYQFDYTLRYILFTGEEQGLLGSKAYASAAKARGETIAGFINLDMISYDADANPIVEMHTRPTGSVDQQIASLFGDIVSAYHLNLTPVIKPDGQASSDHASFWGNGYPGILAIEDTDKLDKDFNPYYHSVGDRISAANLGYFTDIVRASVGAMASLASPEPAALNGRVADSQSDNGLGNATIRASLSPTQTWQTASAADGSYQLGLPAGVYTVTAALMGYYPHISPGIQITAGMTSTLNIALEPYPENHMLYLPLIPRPNHP